MFQRSTFVWYYLVSLDGVVVVLYLEELKFCVIHPSILGTYFPFSLSEAEGKDEARSF